MRRALPGSGGGPTEADDALRLAEVEHAREDVQGGSPHDEGPAEHLGEGREGAAAVASQKE